MSTETVRVEQLDSGLRAAFVNLPHFRTHSARLIINSGSMHETPDAYGAAHFLEHVTHQGTEALPSEQDVHNYSEVNGLYRNAFTSQTNTIYMADGYELEAVGHFVTQTALKPLLTDEALEGERKPIIDELRGYASDPNYYANVAHYRAIRGDLYARPIGGRITDVEQMTPEAIRDYHRWHYRLGNAVLVLSSAEPVERQREYAESIDAVVSSDATDKPPYIELDKFNPYGMSASLQQVNLPLSAQSNVSIAFETPQISRVEEHLSYNLIGSMLSKAAHNKLRRELAVCYGASAVVSRLFDRNFGRNINWAHLNATANINGEDSITGLEALYHDVLSRPLTQDLFDAQMVLFHRDADTLMQSNPSQIANRVVDTLFAEERDEFELGELANFGRSVSFDAIKKMHSDILDSKPLVYATSPDPAVLERVGEWAAQFN